MSGENGDNIVANALNQVFGDGAGAEESDLDNESDVVEGEAESVDSTDATEETAKEEASPAEDVPDELEVPFTDDKGVRQVAKINLKDKESLKKELSLARGARKWQSERDQALNKLKTIEPEYQDIKKSWDTLERAFEDKGIPGVLNLLLGKETGYAEFEANVVAKADKKRTASPLELEKMDLLEKLEVESRQRQRMMKELEAKETSAKEAQARAELEQTEAMTTPAFNEVRFAGKLNDPALEDQLDETIWTQSLRKLETLPEGTQLSKELVKQVFSEVAGAMNKVIARQTDSKVNETITKKKVEAQNKVATAAKTGVGKNGREDQFRKDVSEGSIRNALKKMFD